MRMIIADDEPVIIRGLKKLLDWEKMGIEIVGEYYDGKHALEGIVKQKPELALLDISMPGMTGVEILKEIQSMKLPVQVIFVSGFQDFEYAKAALTYGAVDYLLKPIVRGELTKALEKCIPSRVSEEAASEEKQINFAELVEVETTTYVPVLAEMVYDKDDNELTERLLRFSFLSFLEEYLQEYKRGIVFTKNQNIVLVLKGIERKQCGPVLEEISEKIKGETGKQAAFVVGRQIQNMSEISQVYKECLEMKDVMFFADQKPVPIFFTGNVPFPYLEDRTRLEKEWEALKSALMAQDCKRVKVHFSQYGRLVCRLSEGKKEHACYYFCSLIRRIKEYISSLGLNSNDEETTFLLEQARKCRHYEEMLYLFENDLIQIMEEIREAVQSNEKRDILIAKEYIRSHYQENLTLNILSDEVHMNASYFSSFFKKNTGKNFKEYVNQVRIEQSVSLLLSTDKKTYEIAQNVGFGDARTFSEIFQRFYGETPNAYRKRMKKKKY